LVVYRCWLKPSIDTLDCYLIRWLPFSDSNIVMMYV